MVLLIVPPFQSVERPSLGAHIVKASLKEAGIDSEVLYFNLTFAEIIGFENYKEICESQTSLLLGESIFAPMDIGFDSLQHVSTHTGLSVEFLKNCRAKFKDRSKTIFKEKTFQVAACSSMFQQNNASIYSLDLVKEYDPSIITVMGGGGMAEGHATGIKILLENHYPKVVNYIFSGETERAFVNFIQGLDSREIEYEKIIRPIDPIQMDHVPMVEYSDFFDQAANCTVGITPSTIWLPVESSRGCWWGMKRHCTFCALSETEIIYRKKSKDRVIQQIHKITDQGLTKRVVFVDSILPKNSVEDVFSHFIGEGFKFYMELKVPLSYKDAKIMGQAGVIAVQPGIESLSRDLLKKMKKGIHPFQNIELLCLCKMFGISVEYNFLHGIPGESDQEYEALIALIPLLEHLNPPVSLSQISLERYSPYYDRAEQFGIEKMVPHENYKYCYPYYKGVEEIYCCFIGEYDHLSKSEPQLFSVFETLIYQWIASWQDNRAELFMTQVSENLFLIHDTRKVATKKWHRVDRSKALAAISNKRSSDEQKPWAIENKLAAIVDNIYVPFVTCKPTLYEKLLKL